MAKPSVDAYIWVQKTKLVSPTPTEGISLFQVWIEHFWIADDRGRVAFRPAADDEDGPTAVCSVDITEIEPLCPYRSKPEYIRLIHVPVHTDAATQILVLPR